MNRLTKKQLIHLPEGTEILLKDGDIEHRGNFATVRSKENGLLELRVQRRNGDYYNICFAFEDMDDSGWVYEEDSCHSFYELETRGRDK